MGLFNSLRRNLVDQCSLAARNVVSTLRPQVNQKHAELLLEFPTLDSTKCLLRLWVVESSLVLLAGENARSEAGRLDRFFAAFWAGISAELKSDFPEENVRPEFDASVDRLVSEIVSDHRTLSPDKAAMAMGKRIAAFLQVPDGTRLASVWGAMGVEYGYKLVANAKFLNQLPE